MIIRHAVIHLPWNRHAIFTEPRYGVDLDIAPSMTPPPHTSTLTPSSLPLTRSSTAHTSPLDLAGCATAEFHL